VIKRVLFDIDGTLVNADDRVRPHLKEVVKELLGAGIGIVFWSGGGLDYACTWARRIHPMIKAGFKKVEMAGAGDFVVDDMPYVVETVKKNGGDGYATPPFIKDDKELLRVRDLGVGGR